MATYGLAAVMFLVRIRRRNQLNKWIGNTSAVAALFLYPFLEKAASQYVVRSRHCAYSFTVVTSLLVARNIPAWLSSYLAVESVSDYLQTRGPFQKLLRGLDESRLLRLRQIIFCLLIPTIKASPWLRQTSLVYDFALFYAVWSLLSLYQRAKGCIRRKKPRQPPTCTKAWQQDEWPLVSTSFKPLIDKLAELQELATSNRQTFTETLMNSALAHNVIPSIKWALWRQFCVRVLSQAKLGRTHLMKSLVLMLGFLTLDQNRHMDVSPRILRHLLRAYLKTYVVPLSDHLQMLLILASSNLALHNTKL